MAIYQIVVPILNELPKTNFDATASAASVAASAVCICSVIRGGALRMPLSVHDKIHTGKAAAQAAEAAA